MKFAAKCILTSISAFLSFFFSYLKWYIFFFSKSHGWETACDLGDLHLHATLLQSSLWPRTCSSATGVQRNKGVLSAAWQYQPQGVVCWEMLSWKLGTWEPDLLWNPAQMDGKYFKSQDCNLSPQTLDLEGAEMANVVLLISCLNHWS